MTGNGVERSPGTAENTVLLPAKAVKKNVRPQFRLTRFPLIVYGAGLMLLATPANSALVTVTITGTASGTDGTGVFGLAGTDSDGLPKEFSNQNFTLVYTFDDTKGVQASNLCSNGSLGSSITNTAASNPGTAVLTINGKSFSFGGGAFGESSIYSQALLFSSLPCPGQAPGFGDASYTVGVVYGNNGYSGASVVGGTGAGDYIYPALGTNLTTDPSWEHSFTNSSLRPFSFNFSVGVDFLPPGGHQYQAVDSVSGSLLPMTLTVSGPESSCASPAASLAIDGSDNSRAKRPSPPKPPARPTPHGPVQVTIDTSATGQQPNLLLSNGTTTVNVTVSPAAVLLFTLGASYGTLMPSIVTTNSSNGADATYTAGPSTAADMVTAALGASCAGSVPVYDYNGTLNAPGSPAFDFHQSLVSDTVFVDTTFSASNIQTFFNGVLGVSALSFMSNFYFVGTGTPGSTFVETGGFLDANSNGQLDSGEYVYCPGSVVSGTWTPSTNASCLCPGSTTRTCNTTPSPAVTGTLTSTVLYDVATNTSAGGYIGINPKVLLATMQKEQTLFSTSYETTLPPSSALDNAMGNGNINNSGIGGFYPQLVGGARTLLTHFYDYTSSSFPVYLPVISGVPTEQNFQYSYGGTCTGSHTNYNPNANCALVGFNTNTAGTYTEYRYTPFILDQTGGGGVYLIESVWSKWATNSWYQ